jgi:hypothetical protein
MIASDKDTSDKFFAGINNTSEQLSPVTTTMVINLSPVSTIPVNKARQITVNFEVFFFNAL